MCFTLEKMPGALYSCENTIVTILILISTKQINRLIHTWREEKGDTATLENMQNCLQRAELKGTKHRWWNDYRGQ